MSIDHWMMFGTFAQKEYFEYPKRGTYRGVIINANMAAHAPGGLASFLLEKTHSATYIIDPLTHAFQHDPDMLAGPDGNPKNSLLTLAEAYGSTTAGCVGKQPVQPNDFKDEAVLQEFVDGCIRFQLEKITSYMNESGASKYLDDESKSPPPYAVIAPYFYMSETTVRDWLPINVSAARLAVARSNGEGQKVFAAVVVSKGLISEDDCLKQVVDGMATVGVDGFLVWVDELDETTASQHQLRAFVELCRGLRGPGQREVINTHGGYFSILAAGSLGKNALTGVSHGPEFGEHRGVLPVGGGIPISRYYIPDLHTRIRYQDALRWFRTKHWLDTAETFHGNVCRCDVCVKTLDGDPDKFELFGRANVKNVVRRGGIARIAFPTKEAQQRCLTHYLQKKAREYTAASEAPQDVLLTNLYNGFEKYKLVAGLEGVAHLRKWHNIFAKIVGEAPF